MSGGSIDKDIENLLSVIKIVKSKKPKLIKINFSGMDFLIFGAKKLLSTYKKLLSKL